MLDSSQSIFDHLNALTGAAMKLVSAPGFWLEAGILSAAFLLARLADRRYRRRLDGFLPQGIAHVWWHIGLRGSQRLAFPVTALLLALSARAVLQKMGVAVHLLNLAVPLMLSLALIRLSVFVLQRAFRPTPALRACESGISTIVWIGVVFYLLGWLPAILQALDAVAFRFGDVRVSILSAGKLILALGVFTVVALWSANAIESRVMRSGFLPGGVKAGLVKFSKVALVVVASMVALNSAGIDLTALAVFGGALGVGIGFGLQRIASNFISGFILVLDRSIRLNDVISVGDTYGWVKALRARYIVVRDRDGVERLIPNEQFITSEVVNWSYSDRQVRLKISVQISYRDDPEQAMHLLLEAAKTDRVLEHPKPATRFMGFGDNGIKLQLRVWIADPERGVNSVRSAINLNIWRAFKQAGITIPYPQRDVHFSGAGRDQAMLTDEGNA